MKIKAPVMGGKGGGIQILKEQTLVVSDFSLDEQN